jgi:hypothetical protein
MDRLESITNDLEKMKMSPSEMYLMAIRQVLINQAQEMKFSSHGDLRSTKEVIKRIESFIDNKE